MRVFALFTSSSGKNKGKGNKTTRARTSHAIPDTIVQSQPRSSLEFQRSAANESFMARITGRRAFSISTPHLPNTLPCEMSPALPSKPSVFRRPRFHMFRDVPPASTPRASRLSRSHGAHEALPPVATQGVPSQMEMVIPPIPPLPRPSDPICPICMPRPTVSHPPREPLPVPPVALSRAEAHAVIRSVACAGTEVRRRSRSVTAGSGSSTRTAPALDDVWKDFVRDVAGDIPSISRLRSYDVRSTTRRGPPTRPLPELPKEVPGIAISRGIEDPPGLESEDVRRLATPDALTPRPSLDFMPRFEPSGSSLMSCGSSGPPGLDPTTPCTSQDAIQQLTPPPSDSSLAAASYLRLPGNFMSPQLDHSLSCSSSEISLSLFPLPPTWKNDLPLAACCAVNATVLQPRTLPQSITPRLGVPRGPFECNDPDSPTRPLDAKFSPLLKFYPLKAQASMDSMSTVTTEEWSEITLSCSPSNEDSDLRGLWDDTHKTAKSSYGYDDAVVVYDKMHRVETGELFEDS